MPVLRPHHRIALMRRRQRSTPDQRVTLYLKERATGGRVVRYLDTGMEVIMDDGLDGDLPSGKRIPFTLHLPGYIMSGELTRVSQDGRNARLQFTALTEADQVALKPWTERME